MPSYYESLSMVALEAWALGKPVLANGRCEVLRGQCIRSQAGLYYETQAEFVETLRAITDSRSLNAAFGDNGRQFFQQHYAWPVIEQKYLDMLARLNEEDARGVRHAWSPNLAFSRGGADLRLPQTCWPNFLRTGAELRSRRFIRCSRRSAMAMPSATKCSASSAC